jgi:tripartite motif-containing protein 71
VRIVFRTLLSIALLVVVQPMGLLHVDPAYAATAGGYYGISASPDGARAFASPGGIAGDLSGNVYVADTQNNRIKVLTAAGALQEVWGTRGSGAGQFRDPEGVAVSLSGRVYVADTGNSRVQVFDSSGNYLETWGGPGEADGSFANPVGIAVDTAGNVFVSDTGNSRIQKFSSAGVHLATWGSYGSADGQLSGGRGIAVDAGGYIYVADANNLRIQKFNASGTYVTQWGPYAGPGGTYVSRYVAPYGVAVDGSGSIYIADAGGSVIEKCSSTGIVQATWGSLGSGSGQFDSPRGVVARSGGGIYVADSGNSRIEALDSSGVWVGSWSGLGSGPGELDTPNDSVVATSGLTYVADTGNNRVQILGSDGSYISSWGATGSGAGQFIGPKGIALSSSSTVFVADTGNHRIQSFDASGTHITTFGGSGSLAGQFSSPEDVVIGPSGDVYVADTGNNRVQRLSAAGASLSLWGSFGTGNGQFRAPSGIAVDSSGDVYVVERENHRVQKFSSDGAHLLTWGEWGSTTGEFIAPEGIAVGPSGDVYVADRGNDRIQRFTPSGAFVAAFGMSGAQLGEVNEPVGVDVTSDGRIFVTERGNHRVQVFGHDSVAPVTTAYGVSVGWVSTPTKVTLVASDDAASVAQTLYKVVPPGVNATTIPESLYQGPFTISSDGETRVYYRSIDAVGNEEVAKMVRVRIDSTPPAGVFTIGDGSGYSIVATVSVVSSITGANEMCFDTGAGFSSWVAFSPSTTLTVPGDGVYTVTAQYRDSLSNTSSLQHDLTVDSVAPVTLASGVPSVWATSAVSVTLVATDGTSGVDEVLYRRNSDPEQVYSSAIPVSEEGTTTIAYRAVDLAGNAEEWNLVTVRVDTIPPSGEFNLDAGAASTTTETVTARSLVPDALEMRFDIGDGSGYDVWRAYDATETLVLPGEAVHTVTAQYRDKAGLVLTASDSIIVDHTAPSTVASGVPDGWTNDPVTVTLTASDAVAGVGTIRYSIDDGIEQVFVGVTTSFTVTTEGTTTVTYYSIDAAGNSEAENTVIVRIDTIRPWGTFAIGDGAYYVSSLDTDLISDMQAAEEMRFDLGLGFGSWHAFAPTEATSLSDEGLHVVGAEYRNKAGLVTTRTASVVVDMTTPSTVANVSASSVTTAFVTLEADDSSAVTHVSGVDKTHYRIDGGAWLTYASPIVVTGAGAHIVEYYSVDGVGNRELTKSTPFMVLRAQYTPVSIAGENRYSTAVAVSEAAYPQGASTVVIATGINWPDALGGAALAGVHDAPILLCPTDSLPSLVIDEIERLGAENAIVLGGTSAVSGDVEAALVDLLDGNVTRFGGSNRYETARLIAQEVISRMGEAYDGTALVVTGDNYPDALSGSPLSAANVWPVYLAAPTSDPSRLASNMRADGVRNAFVLGGLNAVSGDYLSALDEGLLGTVDRLAGADRYATSVAVAEYGVSSGLAWDGVAVATGTSFPDALAGGVFAGTLGTCVLLTRSTSLPEPVAMALSAKRDEVIVVHFLGGSEAIGVEVRDAVAQILR